MTDAQDDGALDADGGDASIEDLPCNALEQGWSQFVADSRACERNADCEVFSVQFDDWIICENPRGLQVSLNKDALPIAQRFATRIGSAACLETAGWTALGYDDGWLENATCDDGRCTAGVRPCRVDTDGGE